MAGFSMKQRQAIIDGYLASSGRNQFVPADFVDWLSARPEHEAYPWFFGSDDATAAREHRIALARQMANGLRIVARVTESVTTQGPITVTMSEDAVTNIREFPALISPVASRRSGGGYVAFHPDDPTLSRELQQQGATALRAWLARYRGVMLAAGIGVDPIEKIADAIEARVDGAA